MKKLMTKVLSFVFVIAMVLSMNPMTAKAADGDTPEEAILLNLDMGDPAAAWEGATVYYKVPAKDGDNITLSFGMGSEGSYNLHLYNARFNGYGVVNMDPITDTYTVENVVTSEGYYTFAIEDLTNSYYGISLNVAVEASVSSGDGSSMEQAIALETGDVADAPYSVDGDGWTIAENGKYYKIKMEKGDKLQLEVLEGVIDIFNVDESGTPGYNSMATGEAGFPAEALTVSENPRLPVLYIDDEGWAYFVLVAATEEGGSTIVNVEAAVVAPTVGTEENKEELPIGEETVANTYARPYQAHYYKFAPGEDGLLTITVNAAVCADGYVYSIAGGAWSTDSPEGTVYVMSADGITSSTYYVKSTDEEVVIWFATDAFDAGSVTFTATFDNTVAYPTVDEENEDFVAGTGNDDPSYIMATSPITVTTNTVPVSGDYATTIYTFTATEAGVYTFSTEDGKLGMWNYAFTDPNPTSGTLELELEANMDVMIGLKGANASTATIKVEKTGDLVVKGQETVVYENTATIKPYTFAGVAANLEFIDFEDGEDTTIVLGTDGYYHLGTATGPVILVNLKDTQVLDLADMVNKEQFIAVVIGEEKDVTTNFNAAYAEYVAAADSKTNLYPLTDDLIKIFKEVGKSKGWYLESGWLGAEADAWMFACYYEPETFVNGEGEDGEWIQGTETGYVIHLNININDFKELKINGRVVDPKYYTVKEGSVIITLKPEYLATLEVKAHTVSVVLKDNSTVDTTMTIKAATGTTSTPNPQEPSKGDTINKTGDVANTGIYMVMLLGVAVIAAGAVAKKRYF